jgi:hypothetical protein
MKRITNRRCRRNENLCPLPLFAWAATQLVRSHPRAVKRLSQRFGLSAPLALAIAELAGLNMEVDNV